MHYPLDTALSMFRQCRHQPRWRYFFYSSVFADLHLAPAKLLVVQPMVKATDEDGVPTAFESIWLVANECRYLTLVSVPPVPRRGSQDLEDCFMALLKSAAGHSSICINFVLDFFAHILQHFHRQPCYA